MTHPAPPDHSQRTLIQTALDDNLLVEAGAGSGKTTALVDRMLRLIASGAADAGEIAAVTFTRKAAGELRQRFQERLERALIDGRLDPGGPPLDAEITARLHSALRAIDRAFMGTIHAFCARLLRERPFEARLDPAFRELTGPEAQRSARAYWESYLEQLTDADDRRLTDLADVGLRPSQLFANFHELGEATDVEFPLGDVSPPAPDAMRRVRTQVEAILDDARPGLPDHRPGTRCTLQTTIRELLYQRAVLDWDRRDHFMRSVAALCARKVKPTLKHWTFERERVKDLESRVNALIEVTDERPDPPARALLRRWRAHAHGPVLALTLDAARRFAEHRRSIGELTFQDLLEFATDLLRRSPNARRGLGLRWRRILVDEFQDTDPLQAELLFLLASDPARDPPGDGPPPWTRLTPRPGALFVVGDPKQSIYRFRRADIELYGRVRARFADFGRVVRLESNFRSTAPIERVVEGVFDPALGALFPADGTDRQAGYAPLLTQPRATPAIKEGVFRYTVPADVSSTTKLMAWEPAALAGWIAGRVASGERRPEDFLVLTHRKRHLGAYARAIEAHHLPVTVTGSGVGIEEELGELRIVLESLVDPTNRLLTLATLEGLFFGLDPRQLLLHTEAGGTLDYQRQNQPPGPVADALTQLRGWWEAARDRPADEVVEQIASSIGLLPWAASGALGGLRAGALAFTLDLIRGAGDASLAGALDTVALVLDSDDHEMEASIEPARGGAVRVMNLHKAKGLEAAVVILAHPMGTMPTGRSLVVERDADGNSIGWCAAVERTGPTTTTLSAVEDWEERKERELEFERAEHDRLLYVAVTRAVDELVVGVTARGGKGAWAALDDWLLTHAEELALHPTPEPAPILLSTPIATLQAAEAAAADRRARAAESSGRFETVTGVVHAGAAPDAATALGSHDIAGAGPGGMGWGNAVHLTLEQALAGVDARALVQVARAALLEHDRPVDRHGDPVDLPALLRLVERIRASELWNRALAAEVRLTEQPFALEYEPGRWLEGVIDLAFREPEGWVIVDYKTASDDRAFKLHLPRYQQQVALYAEAWSRLTGEPVADAQVWRVG